MAATLKRHHRRRAPLAVYAPLALTERPALQRYRGNDSIKTTAQRHPSETPAQYPPLPYQYPRPHDPRRKARLVRLWLHLVASLVVWPAIFGTVVIATFVGVVVVYNEFAGPLFWPLAWIITAIAYSLVAGIPLAICGRSRRWYLRLIPAVTAAVPFAWLGILFGIGTIPVTATGLLWLMPSVATVALSIWLQTAPWWGPRCDVRRE